MAIGVLNPQILSPEQANPILYGMNQAANISNILAQSRLTKQQAAMQQLNAEKMQKLMPFVSPMAHQQLLAQQQQNQFNPQIWQSESNMRNAQVPYYQAQTNKMNAMVPLEAEELRLKNKSYPDYIKSQINMYNMGGRGGMGTGAKEELTFQSFVQKDNPKLRPDQVYEASNILRQGGSQLPDGTPLNPLSPASEESLNRITKYGTTSPIITQGIQASQAEAELPIYDKAIREGVKPYGTTTFGHSPQQIEDSINIHDHAAQERLGKYLGAQQLLYDRAALTLKINSLPPGVTLADEIRKLSVQSVNAKFPMMSDEARKVASEFVAKTLREGLKARKSVNTGSSSVRSVRSLENTEHISKIMGQKGSKNPAEMTDDEIRQELGML